MNALEIVVAAILGLAFLSALVIGVGQSEPAPAKTYSGYSSSDARPWAAITGLGVLLLFVLGMTLMIIQNNAANGEIEVRKADQQAERAAQIEAFNLKSCGLYGNQPCRCKNKETVIRHILPGEKIQIRTKGEIVLNPSPSPTLRFCNFQNACKTGPGMLQSDGIDTLENLGSETVALRCHYE